MLTAQRQEAARQEKELKTALAKAERDLSFTVIRAPFDGVIGNRAMQVGDYVQTGQRLAAWCRSTSLHRRQFQGDATLAAHRSTGRRSASTRCHRRHHGTVESVSPASGSVFSLLPPDNATGNFTKIVQRLAVRIRLPPTVTEQRLFRPGMSVVVSVNTARCAVAANASRSAAGDAAHWLAAQW